MTSSSPVWNVGGGSRLRWSGGEKSSKTVSRFDRVLSFAQLPRERRLKGRPLVTLIAVWSGDKLNGKVEEKTRFSCFEGDQGSRAIMSDRLLHCASPFGLFYTTFAQTNKPSARKCLAKMKDPLFSVLQSGCAECNCSTRHECCIS
jgi:hypothetical protein